MSKLASDKDLFLFVSKPRKFRNQKNVSKKHVCSGPPRFSTVANVSANIGDKRVMQKCDRCSKRQEDSLDILGPAGDTRRHRQTDGRQISGRLDTSMGH